MNATVPFVKMNGTRNEFVVVDAREIAARRSGRVRAAHLRSRAGPRRRRLAARARIDDGRRAHAHHQRRRQRGRDVRQRHPVLRALSRRARRPRRSGGRDDRRTDRDAHPLARAVSGLGSDGRAADRRAARGRRLSRDAGRRRQSARRDLRRRSGGDRYLDARTAHRDATRAIPRARTCTSCRSWATACACCTGNAARARRRPAGRARSRARRSRSASADSARP